MRNYYVKCSFTAFSFRNTVARGILLPTLCTNVVTWNHLIMISDLAASESHDSILPQSSSRGKASTNTPRSRGTRAQESALLGVGDLLGAGDSYLVEDMLPGELAGVSFESMREEVMWNTMYHRGG